MKLLGVAALSEKISRKSSQSHWQAISIRKATEDVVHHRLPQILFHERNVLVGCGVKNGCT
jgi:hypothetical protein